MEFDREGHIRVRPIEVQNYLMTDPDGLINHVLLPGTPHAFPTYEQYSKFLDHLSTGLGIHPGNFLFRGSTKLGFSISPNLKDRKVWRACGPNSDLDLAIIDPHFYSMLDEEVRRYDRSHIKKILRAPNSDLVSQYLNRIHHKGKHDCYRYFDLPRELACMRDVARILNSAPVLDCCLFPFPKFEAFVYRDRWAVFRRYHTDLNDLRRGLTAKTAPFPQGGAEPLPG